MLKALVTQAGHQGLSNASTPDSSEDTEAALKTFTAILFVLFFSVGVLR